MKRNVILLTQFAVVYLLTNFLHPWSCIHKSYIIYFEISVLPIGHGFSFFGDGKVVEKVGAPCIIFRKQQPFKSSSSHHSAGRRDLGGWNTHFSVMLPIAKLLRPLF